MSRSDVTRFPQYSTAASDGVLGTITGIMAWEMFKSHRFYASLGFSLVVAAAVCGVLRFSQARPSNTLVTWHQYLSWLAHSVGMPFIAASFIQSHYASTAVLVALIPVVVAVLGSRFISSSTCHTIGELLANLAVAAVFILGCVTANGFAIVGTALLAFAGLVVKTEGHIGGFLRVDVFHYLLSIANIALMKGLLVYDLPTLYYKP